MDKSDRRKKMNDDKHRKEKQKRNINKKNEKTNQSNSESKPQRENKRQPGQTPTPNIGQAGDKVENSRTESVTEEVKGETFVDHSHLKRETEEIEKLTKRNPNRHQITSSWEAFTIPASEGGGQKEESRAIDFASLLHDGCQTSGGHFKFKEEKQWAAESEAILNSYLALDLNLLAQGLACIPFYERHQLSTDLFSEEELKKMQATARQNEEFYKHNKDTNSYSKPQTTNVCENRTIIVKTEPHEDALGLTDSIIPRVQKIDLTNIEDKPDKVSTQFTTNLEQTMYEEEIFENMPLLSPADNTTIIVESIINEAAEIDIQNPTETINQCPQTINKTKLSQSVVSKSPVDDDDELDFLLSLKEPVKETSKPEVSTAETTVVVSGGVDSPELCAKPEVVPVQHNVLDDWLDSFLDD